MEILFALLLGVAFISVVALTILLVVLIGEYAFLLLDKVVMRVDIHIPRIAWKVVMAALFILFLVSIYVLGEIIRIEFFA